MRLLTSNRERSLANYGANGAGYKPRMRDIEARVVRLRFIGNFLAVLALAGLLTGAAAAAEEPARGPVTNLPLPRFVSLKTSEGNARRGPSLSHRIDWVFRHPSMPLRLTAEYGHWRRVEDREGQGGWVHYSLLSGVRTVVVTEDLAELHLKPDPGTPVMAQAEQGAIARLGACDPLWCQISASGQKGWVPKTALWGVDPDEVRE